MSKVAGVTASSGNIPQPLLAQYGIYVVPQILIWDQITYEDGVDITPEQFYTRLKTSQTSPSTSQATPSHFHQIFQTLLEQDYQVLAVLISAQLSGTICSALQAQEDFRRAPIEIVDSGTASMAMGLQVLAVSRAAEQGANLAECKALAEKARDNVGILFAVDTLEYLHRGGRIGGASRFLGTALNIKPILEVVNGRVEAIERVRTRAKSLARLLELAEERMHNRRPQALATLHANAPAEARELLKICRQKFSVQDLIYSEVSPVIGTHTGPGTVGLAYMTEM